MSALNASIDSLVSSNLGGLSTAHTLIPFFNLPKRRTIWYLGHFANPPLKASHLGHCDEVGHLIIDGYRGLWTVWLGSHRGSWKLKTNGMCLGLAEVTLKRRQAAANCRHLSSGRERQEHDTCLLKLGPPPLSLRQQNLGNNLTAKCSWEKEKCVEFALLSELRQGMKVRKKEREAFCSWQIQRRASGSQRCPWGIIWGTADRHFSWLLLIIFNYLGKACVKQRPTKSRQAAELALTIPFASDPLYPKADKRICSLGVLPNHNPQGRKEVLNSSYRPLNPGWVSMKYPLKSPGKPL